MPITGKFIADFTAFQTAVQQAEVSLKGMETGASKVQTSLNRMVDSLGGRKLVQEATLAAEAVERIGGVSKLTEAELQKLGGQALEASNKLKAMGQEVPPGIQKIVDAANKVKPALDSATSSASGLMGTVTEGRRHLRDRLLRASIGWLRREGVRCGERGQGSLRESRPLYR